MPLPTSPEAQDTYRYGIESPGPTDQFYGYSTCLPPHSLGRKTGFAYLASDWARPPPLCRWV